MKFYLSTSISTIAFMYLSCVSNAVDQTPSEVFESERSQFIMDTIFDDLKYPNGMVWLADGKILIAERGDTTGYINTYDQKTKKSKRICGLPKIHRKGDGGLLDIRLHPKYPEEPHLYFAYSIMLPDSSSTLVVDRALVSDDCLVDQQRLLAVHPPFHSNAHFGCRIALHREYLFITMGERYSERDSAQTLTNHFGKIMRLNLDGSVPIDNPFVSTPGALPEIYSLGHRSPQGLIWHPSREELWEHEHGPQGGDELNVIVAGSNYGWPIVTFGEEYGGGVIGEGFTELDGMVSPIYQYTPSIAPSDMIVYSGKKFPAWRGNIFIGAMALQHLNRLEVSGNQVLHEERLLTDREWRVRMVREGPDGQIYLGIDNGLLISLSPVSNL